MAVRQSSTKVLHSDDQDVKSGASPVLAVTNMTGSAAGLDSDATAHAAADGSSHTFIDQDVTSGASPVLAVTNMTGSAAGIDSDATSHAAADGSSHTFIDQDVTSGASPVLAVTNMTGSAAGLDSDATTHAASSGTDHSAVAVKPRVIVTGCELETLNNEQSTAIGLAAGDEFVPIYAILHLEDVGAGAAAAGDAAITIGTSAGGTQILPATTLTGLNALNERFVIPIAGLTAAIAANSTIYCKITTADTTAGAGHLLDLYLIGETFTSGT